MDSAKVLEYKANTRRIKMATLPSRYQNRLAQIVAILVSSTIMRPLNTFTALEITNQVALVKFNPVNSKDRVLPFFVFPASPQYGELMDTFCEKFTHNPGCLGVMPPRGKAWYTGCEELIRDILASLPETATEQTRNYIRFHLYNALTWHGNPPYTG